ncbi:HAMP domain-containing protein [Paenibacillus sp. P26]|nr:HAMP domain-containing protein [Paenibacillus sp. P26]
MNVWAYLRRTNVILFITLQGCFLLILTIIAYGYSYNWQDVFERYQEDQLKVNAYKMIDDIRNEELGTGPYTDEQISWLTRRATLYGILIRYGSDRQTIWFDMFPRIGNTEEMKIQEYPVIAKGSNRGVLQVAYLKKRDKLDPSFLAYENMMDRRSAMLFGVASLLSIVVSYIVSRRLSVHWNHLKETAALIRGGDREVRAPVKGPEEVRQLAVTLNELSMELKKQEDWRHHLMEDLTHDAHADDLDAVPAGGNDRRHL